MTEITQVESGEPLCRLEPVAESVVRNIPQRVLASIQRYAQYGYPCGSFVTAVLENNLVDAVFRADKRSLAALPDICKFVYNALPGYCWGSREKCRVHLAKGAEMRRRESGDSR